MNTIEKSRRELFETWYSSLAWPMCEKCSKDEYIAWQGFNAALDLLVIEMPFTKYYSETQFVYGVDASRKAIESLNLGIKIK